MSWLGNLGHDLKGWGLDALHAPGQSLEWLHSKMGATSATGAPMFTVNGESVSLSPDGIAEATERHGRNAVADALDSYITSQL